MIKLTILALALLSAPGCNFFFARTSLVAGWGLGTSNTDVARAAEIGDSPEPIPPRR